MLQRLISLCIATIAITVALGACGSSAARARGIACGGPVEAIFHSAGSPRLALEVARSDAERGTGLMNRTALGADAGMVFVFESPTQARFWMKDTLIPLSIAFIAADGTILDIQDMQPETLDPHAAPGPYVYAIEANQGWYSAHGVQPGQTVDVCFGDASAGS